MPRDAPLISLNEREFILEAVREEQRVDGRRPFDYRPISIAFGRADGSAEVQLGQTRVMAVVTAELATPYPDRPNEGSLSIFTEFSPMADPSFEPGRPGESAVELGRVVDRGLRESRALDVEALCVVAGRYVWAVRVDLHILDNGGNLVDAANLAALAGILSFRRPECSVGGADGQEVTVHSVEERDPQPLALHHLPVAVTFAFMNDGQNTILDPNLKEEAAMGGRMTLTLNAHGEINAIQKGGGVPVTQGEILRCLRIASNKAKELAKIVKTAAEAHIKQRLEGKVKRHAYGGAGQRVALQPRQEAIQQLPAAQDAEQQTEDQSTQLHNQEAAQNGAQAEVDEDGAMREEAEEEEEDGEQERLEHTMIMDQGPEHGGASKRSKSELFQGQTSSWLDEPDCQQKSRHRGKVYDAAAVDEFAHVAALLGTGPSRSAASPQAREKVSAAAVYAAHREKQGGLQGSTGHGGHIRKPLIPSVPESMAVDSDEDREATVQLQGEFVTSADQGLPSRPEAGGTSEGANETLLSAVKKKEDRRKVPKKGRR